MKRGIHKYGLLAFLWLTYTLPALADPNDPDDGDDPQAPIDNWLLLLILAGVALGIYFIMKNKNKQIA
ncbi:hypothetical protein [Moheibacter sediminis]|uniref:LPXTG-motif cell wall anchor domain-containing protein n=1 Tax=Moheibacter sediminis TaxID=1434700 RepID=A0A1W2CKR1_9FLAO|nr:hypothetical protein [Moheibacter sediminis]SMC85793.1 hypothetical protein SAMN06296427_1111 [Moheibacter sediminis]